METIHKDHRERLRKRFLTHGLDSFSDHEVLELLLFYSKPRVNTNPTAHELMKRYGTLAGVLEAGYDDLCSVDGVGASSACLIKLMLPLFRRYSSDRKASKKTYEIKDDVGRFLVNHYIGESREKVTLLLFDAAFRMTDVITIHEGSVTSSDINPNKVAEIVFSRRAASFVISHNHPGGTAKPSRADLLLTKNLYDAFRGFDVKLREHFIVAGGDYHPILEESINYFSAYC